MCAALRRGRRDARPAPGITARQAEVIGLVARGYTNKEIAAALGISTRGVAAQVSRLCAKFGVPSRAGLIGRVVAAAGFGLPVGHRPPPTRLGLQAHIAFGPEGEFEVYRHAPFLVTITEGPEHRYSFVNEAAQRVAGMSAERMIGRPAGEVFKLGEAWDALWERAFASGEPTFADSIPARWTADDGSRRQAIFGFVFQPLIGSDGTVIGLMHIGTEVV